MAFENIPLFSHMNSEEVKKPFPPKPPRPMTGQELSMEVLRRVEAVIHDVNNFKECVRRDFERFINASNTENTSFKESMQATYNAFATALQNEVNNFEQSMQSQYDSFVTNAELRADNFETSINEKMEEFKSNINTAYDNFEKTANEKIGEFNSKITKLYEWEEEQVQRYNEFISSINASFSEHKQAVNTSLTAHITSCRQWEENVLANIANRHAEQDGVILEAKNYMKNKIQVTTRAIFDEKVKDGTIEEITKTVFGDAHTFKGIKETVTAITSVANPETGDYYMCEADNCFYMHTSTGEWVNLGVFTGNTQEVKDARTNKAGVEYSSLKEAIDNAILYYNQVVNGHEALAVTADLQQYSIATDNFTFNNTGEVATFTCNGQGSTYVGMYVDIPLALIDVGLPLTLQFKAEQVKTPIAISLQMVVPMKDGLVTTIGVGDSHIRQIYSAGEKVVTFNPFAIPAMNPYPDRIRVLFHNQTDGDVACSITDFMVYNDVTSSFRGDTLASTIDNLGKYVEKFNNFENIGNISTKYGVEMWKLWGKPSNCELLADTVNYEFTGESGNNGICTEFLDKYLNFSRIAYIKLTATGVTGKINVTAWAKKVDNTNAPMQTLKVITADGDYIIPLDLQYLCAHKDYNHSIYVLIHNDGTGAKITITNLEIYQHDVEASFVGSNLKETLGNIEKEFEAVREEMGNIDTGDHITNNNITNVTNVTEVKNITNITSTDLKLIDETGRKYALHIDSMGELHASRVAPEMTLVIGNSLVGGFGNYGMASSDSEHDFVAYLGKGIDEVRGSGGVRFTMSGSDFEACESNAEVLEWMSNLTGSEYVVNKYPIELVIIQLGDNVNTDEKKAIFKDSCRVLLEKVHELIPTARVAWVASWYGNDELRGWIKNACTATGSIFIDIHDLHTTENENYVGAVYYAGDKEYSLPNVWVYDLYVETLEDGQAVARFHITTGSYGADVELPIAGKDYISFSPNPNGDGEGTLSWVGEYNIITNPGVASHPSNKGMCAIANRIAYVLGITEDEKSIAE